MAKRFFGYFGDKATGKGKRRGFCFSTDLDEVKKMLGSSEDAQGSSNELTIDDTAQSEKIPDNSGLAEEMARAKTMGLSQSHLIGLATQLLNPLRLHRSASIESFSRQVIYNSQ